MLRLLCVLLGGACTYIARSGARVVGAFSAVVVDHRVRQEMDQAGGSACVLRVLAKSTQDGAGIASVIPVDRNPTVHHGDLALIRARWSRYDADADGDYCPFVIGCVVEVAPSSLVDGETYFLFRAQPATAGLLLPTRPMSVNQGVVVL